VECSSKPPDTKDMKRVVSVSLGSSKRDKKVEVEFLGERFAIERVGVDGDKDRFRRLVGELDGQVDAIGLGGIDMYIVSAGRRYAFRDAKKLVELAKTTPVVDGSGLKNTLERETIKYLERERIVEFAGRRVLMVCAVDRFGMAEGLAQTGAQMILGDVMFALGYAIPIRSWAFHRLLARALLPVITRMPFEMFYPTGEKQEKRKPKFGKYYAWADIIAGDYHYINKHLPDRLDSKIIITNTTTDEDVETYRERGVKMLVTSTPEFEGRSFGANVMEGVCIALLGKRPDETTIADYMSVINRLNWSPRVSVLD
jgi:hypothetical protein